MKIGLKITMLIVIAVVGIAIISIMSLLSLGSLNNMFTYIGDRPFKNLRMSCEVIDNINIIAWNSAVACFDTTHANKRLDAMHEASTLLWAKIDTIKNNVVAEHMIKQANKVTELLNAQKDLRRDFEEAINNNNFALAQKMRLENYADAINSAVEAANELAWAANDQVEQVVYVESEAEFDKAKTTLITCIVIVVIVLTIIAMIIIFGITKPLKKAVEAAEKISLGDFQVDLESNAKDETGMLIRSMEQMKDKINAMATDINSAIHNALDGNLQFRADATKHQGGYQEMIKGLNDLTNAFIDPIELCAQSFQYIANGDTKLQEITKEYKGDFNKITQSINIAVRTLYTVLGEITSTGDAAKNGDLSKRADTSKVQGAWVAMMGGLNGIMEAADSIINEAGSTLATMATGDLTPRITSEYKGKFLEMKGNINNLGDSLTDLISQLQDAIHTTASASAQISSTADSLAAATQEQSSQTADIASAVEEMSRTVTDNAHSASRTADVARQSGSVADSGGQVVEQTVAKMKEIADVVSISASNISKLGESSKKIGEIISVIDDIADQTNLLSLNAAIEAARAGEQGRGFAVVADSVGKLAVSTASATKEIADMIKGIQLDTEAAVRAMERGTSEVQSGIDLADNAGKSIQNILTGINELLDMVNQIAAASEQQSATSEQISRSVSSMSRVTADSAKNIEDVATTANELAKMTDTLTSLVSQFKISGGRNGRSLALTSSYME